MVGVGARVAAVPVDEQGLDVARLSRGHARAAPGLRDAVAPVPRPACPLALERRLELVAWAREVGALDLRGRLRQRNSATEAVRCRACRGSRRQPGVLTPARSRRCCSRECASATWSSRSRLVEAFRSLRVHADGHTNPFTQAVVCDLLEGGQFESHLRRMRQIYGERRRLFSTELRHAFGEALAIGYADAGLHLCARFVQTGGRPRVRTEPRGAAGVWVEPLSRYGVEGPAAPGLVMGDAGYDEGEIRAATAKLGRVWAAFAGGRESTC